MCHTPPPWRDGVFCFTVRSLGFTEPNTNASYSRHPHPLTMKIYTLTQLPTCMYDIIWYYSVKWQKHSQTQTFMNLKIKTQHRPPCAYLTKHPLYHVNFFLFFFSPTCPIFPSFCRFMGSKMGAGPSITSNISVSNLMRRCEWILKQAGEAPGEACAGPPGPAAGLNKYAAEQTCRQLGPRYGPPLFVLWLCEGTEEKAVRLQHVSWEKKKSKKHTPRGK